MTRTTIHESARTVVQVLRLAPNAEIAEHHHPFFDENMILEQGSVSAVLNGKTYELHPSAIPGIRVRCQLPDSLTTDAYESYCRGLAE